jgi:cytochrome P450
MNLMNVFLTLFAFVIVYALWKLFKSLLSRRNFFHLLHSKSKTQQFSVLPLNFGIGQIYEFINLSEPSYIHWSEAAYKGNGTAVLNFFTQPYLLTADPEIIKQITITKRLPKASVIYDLLKPLFGNGILLSSGELWKKQRTLINPIFTPQNVFLNLFIFRFQN